MDHGPANHNLLIFPSRQTNVPDSGHIIPMEKPQAVVDTACQVRNAVDVK
jgi:hypothetical protein